MKLSEEQISIIKKFVDERKYDSKKVVAYLEKHNIIEKGQMWGPTLTAYSHIEPNRMLPEEFQNLEEMSYTLY